MPVATTACEDCNLPAVFARHSTAILTSVVVAVGVIGYWLGTGCRLTSAIVLTVAVVGAGLVGYFIGRKATSNRRVNKTQKLDSAKVVTMVDVEDVGDKTAYCRCWQSKTFPKCDGSHNEHNKLTGDNLGPLFVENKAAAKIK